MTQRDGLSSQNPYSLVWVLSVVMVVKHRLGESLEHPLRQVMSSKVSLVCV